MVAENSLKQFLFCQIVFFRYRCSAFQKKKHLPRGEIVLQKNKINENKNQKNKFCVWHCFRELLAIALNSFSVWNAIFHCRGSLFVKSKCSRSEEPISSILNLLKFSPKWTLKKFFFFQTIETKPSGQHVFLRNFCSSSIQSCVGLTSESKKKFST